MLNWIEYNYDPNANKLGERAGIVCAPGSRDYILLYARGCRALKSRVADDAL